MKISELLNKSKDTLISFEILPPLKGANIHTLFESLQPLIDAKPAFFDVTYHREEVIYKEHKNGLLEKQSIKKRPGTVAICSAIKNKFNIETIPHIICGGFNKEETENALIDLNFLGIENIMVLRGDPVKTDNRFIPEKNGHAYASELLGQVMNMNQGKYLYDELENAVQTDFCVGVAGYPEKHYESPNLQQDLHYLKHKVDLGAEYIVTQMFFDNQKYFDFVKQCRAIGITVPIIPGIKPVTGLKQITSIPSNFYIDLPDDFVKELDKAKNTEDARRIGVEWCVQQVKELIQHKVPSIHFYTMSRSQSILEILKEI